MSDTKWIKVYADDVMSPNGDVIHDGVVLDTHLELHRGAAFGADPMDWVTFVRAMPDDVAVEFLRRIADEHLWERRADAAWEFADLLKDAK
jgi:hypothetical protein